MQYIPHSPDSVIVGNKLPLFCEYITSCMAKSRKTLLLFDQPILPILNMFTPLNMYFIFKKHFSSFFLFFILFIFPVLPIPFLIAWITVKALLEDT